jgi:hypothetical protein
MALGDLDLRWILARATQQLLGVEGIVDEQRWFQPMTKIDALVHLEATSTPFGKLIETWTGLGTLSWPRAIDAASLNTELAAGMASLVVMTKASAPKEEDVNQLVGFQAAVRGHHPDRALVPLLLSTEPLADDAADARDQQGVACLTLPAAHVEETASAAGFATGKPDLEESEKMTAAQRELVEFQSEHLSDVEGLKTHMVGAYRPDSRLRQLRFADMLARAFADKGVARFDLSTTAMHSQDVLLDGMMGNLELTNKRAHYDIFHFFKSPQWPNDHPGALQIATGSMALLFKLGYGKKAAEARFDGFVEQAKRSVGGFALRKEQVRSWPIVMFDRQFDQAMETFCRLFVDIYEPQQ